MNYCYHLRRKAPFQLNSDSETTHFLHAARQCFDRMFLNFSTKTKKTSGFEDTLLVISITMAHIRFTYINESFDPKFAILLKFLSQFPALIDGLPSNLPVAILESQDNSFASMQLHTL